MADTEITTRPAWVLAGASILMLAVLLLVWGQAAAADCAPVHFADEATCADGDEAQPTPWGMTR
jgi:hypothetical protein